MKKNKFNQIHGIGSNKPKLQHTFTHGEKKTKFPSNLKIIIYLMLY